MRLLLTSAGVPAALALALLTGSAAAETRPGYGGAIIGGLPGEPVELDPTRAQSHAELTLAALLFDALYRVDGKEPGGAPRITAHLAADLPALSADGRSARIEIRPGVTFHDGRPLDAEDVARSLRRLAKSPWGWLVASVRGVRRQGDAVILELSRPTPDLAALLSAPAAAITPGGAAPTWARAVGSGPFKLERIDRSARRVRLAAAAAHFAGRPYVNSIELRWFERGDDEAAAYEAGRSHLSLRGAVAYAGHSPKYATREATGPATLLAYVGFGKTAAHQRITESRPFRRALSLALDRNGFRGVGAGERVVPALHPVPAAMGGPAAAAGERRARLREARAALARAAAQAPLLADAVAGRRAGLELELIVDSTRPDDREIAERVVAALFRLHVRARITSLSAPEFARRVRAGACDLYIGQLPVAAPAPAHILAAAFAAGGDPFAGRELAARELDLTRAGRVFAERLPLIPLFHRALRVHHRTNVRGIRFDDASQISFADVFLFGKTEPPR